MPLQPMPSPSSGRGAISYFRPEALAGRVALVTGGGSGIGFEIARQFGLHGCKGVVIMGRRQKFLHDAVGLLTSEGVQAAAFAGDVRKFEDCEAAVSKAIAAFGSLDVLVNAAAGNFLAAAEEISANGFRTVLDIDTQGTFNMTRAAFASLRDSAFGGVVTTISATLHYTATWYQSAPVAAKAANDALMRNLALEWGEFGIRLNSVAPGPIVDTPGWDKLKGGMAGSAKIFDAVPVRRAGTMAEVASACIYLCLNGYITGEILVVDGGSWFGRFPVVPREAILQMSRQAEKGSRDRGPGAASKPTSKL